MSESLEGRRKMIDGIYVEYPRLTKIFGRLSRCHDSAKRAGETRCVAIMGRGGTGKTTVYERYCAKFPRRTTSDGDEVPVFAATIPKSPSIKSTVTALLSSLGDPLPAKGTDSRQRTEKLHTQLKNARVEMMIFDEFQHIINLDTNRALYETADWIKDLYNLTRIPIAVFGTPAIDRLFRANDQLAWRFSSRAILEPFNWRTRDGLNEFRTFLKMVDEALPFSCHSGLSQVPIASRIFWGSRGLIGRTMELIKGAAHEALDRGDDLVTLEALEMAYEYYCCDDINASRNPFTKKFDASSPPPLEKGVESGTNDIGPTKKQRIGHVLRTTRSG